MNKLLCRFLFLVVILLHLGICAIAQDNTRQELNSKWLFRNTEDIVWHKAIVPGNIFTDLYRNDLIENPLFGKNFEKLIPQIQNENWEYTTYFDLNNTKSFFNKKEFELVFEGINTYAEIILNGNRLLLTDNCFVAINI